MISSSNKKHFVTNFPSKINGFFSATSLLIYLLDRIIFIEVSLNDFFEVLIKRSYSQVNQKNLLPDGYIMYLKYIVKNFPL